MEVVAHGPAGEVAEPEAPQDRRAPQVEIPVFEAQGLVDLRVVLEREGQRPAVVQDAQLGRLDLDRAGGQARVLGAGRARRHRSPHRHHVLSTHRLGPAVGGRSLRRVEHALGETLAIPDVDEDQPAVVAAPEGPSHQGDDLSDVLGPKDAAAMRALPAPEGLRPDVTGVDRARPVGVDRARPAHPVSSPAPSRPRSARAISSSPSRSSGTFRCDPEAISRMIASLRASSLSPAITA